MPDNLWLNGHPVALADLRTAPGAAPAAPPALATVQAWLTGADTFRLHSSGSTGAPKEVRLTRAQVLASLPAPPPAAIVEMIPTLMLDHDQILSGPTPP